MTDQLPFAITLETGSSEANKTGSWRTERAVYVDRLPPCSNACPAGEDIQGWLYDAESGDSGYERAWRLIMRVNPFPAVMGRVCYHPCETACNRGQLDDSVGINSVERFIGDEAIEQGWRVEVEHEATGKRVLVVGAGPAGLSAAYHLALLGHDVTVRDAGKKAGGMMRYGIPTYRLPRDVLDAEVQRIVDLGVSLELDTTVREVAALVDTGEFDAVFLAVGAGIGKKAYVPAGSAAHVVDALSALHKLEEGEQPMLGRAVAVYGGGNTAMDAARTAKRLGASDAIVVYRRTRDRMPAHESEVREAEAEGVVFKWLTTVTRADEGKLLVERMELDGTGFPRPTGVVEELAADSLVLALGQDCDLTLVQDAPDVVVHNGTVEVDDLLTGHRAIFAGGDMVPSERSATSSIGQGRRAAQSIDSFLSGDELKAPPLQALAEFSTLNTWYYSDASRTHRPLLEQVRRQSTFDEVVIGLDADTALFEARRCLSCGNCFSCDNCFSICPDNAIRKVGDPGSYEIDLDYCKGCGPCVAECPSGAIQMFPEQI